MNSGLDALSLSLPVVEEARSALVEKEGAVEEVKKSSSESLPYTGRLLFLWGEAEGGSDSEKLLVLPLSFLLL